MTYILRRANGGLPSDIDLLKKNVWYNIWERKSAPYDVININSKIIIKVNNCYYQAKFKTILKHQFDDWTIRYKCDCHDRNDSLLNILITLGYTPYNEDPYWSTKINIKKGYLLAYKFKEIKHLKKLPNNIRWYRNGWGIIENI